MAGVDYKTKTADYRQVYEIHTLPVKDPAFEDPQRPSIDAVVLEAYHPEKWFEAYWKSPIRQNHKAVLEFAQKAGKPIYVVDVLTTVGAGTFEDLSSLALDGAGLAMLYDGTKRIRDAARAKTSRREFFKTISQKMPEVAAGAFFASHLIYEGVAIQSGEMPEPIAKVQALRTHILPTPRFGLRDAICARKIDEYVAPELQERLGRRPRIAIVCGAGHSGLRQDLQVPWLRDLYIRLYRSLGYPGIDTTYLDVVTNLQQDGAGHYSLTHRNSKLFK
jgi:hypothetical protein